MNETFFVNDDDDSGDLGSIISNVTSKILNNNDKSSGNESFSIDTNLNYSLKGKNPFCILILNQIFN